MNELKAQHALDVYEEYTKTGDDEKAQVYLKSEVDAALRHQKYKRCLAMAKWCDAEAGNVIDEGCYRYMLWCTRYERWLDLAEKFKEAK